MLVITIAIFIVFFSYPSHARIGDNYSCTSKDVLASFGEEITKRKDKLNLNFKWEKDSINIEGISKKIPIVKQTTNSFDAFDGIQLITLKYNDRYNNFLIQTETTFDKVGFVFITYRCKKNS